MLKRLTQIAIAGFLVLPGFAGAAAVVQLPATNQTACFNENGDPRPCTGTGEDGESKAGVAWPVSRFSDNGNGTVKDTLTGLVWSKHANAPNRALAVDPPNACPNAENEMTWLQALDFIACLNTSSHAGANDWRLPNLNELESMVNAGVADTSAYLNANGFGLGTTNSEVKTGQYWTSTSDASEPVNQISSNSLSAFAAWDIDLRGGDYPASSGKNDPVLVTRSVWPVRGASASPAMLLRTGQTACFDEVGDIRTCAGTGEDGEKLAGAAWPVPRFSTNAGATLAFDRLTGLVWSTAAQSPGPSACNDTGFDMPWQQALNHVACLNANFYLGLSNWRLPNRNELHSLADYSKGGPALPVGHPFSDHDGFTYWSATTNAVSTKDAWAVSMFDGSLGSAIKSATLPVWPVSGPDAASPAVTIAQGSMISKAASMTVSGTVESGAAVTVTVNGGAPVAATVSGTSWSCNISSLLAGANNITVKAVDLSENQGTASASITFTAPDGIITGGSAVRIEDALRALRLAVGIITPSSSDLLRGDVAPHGAPDDRIDVTDVLMLLRKVAGLPSF